MRRAVLSLLAGVCWGGVAILLGQQALGGSLWAGVLASPVVGLVIGIATQPVFERVTGWKRTATALCSLYCGGALFALPMGVYDAVARSAPGRDAIGVILEMQMGVAWGVTMFGIGLWPLAYFTHFLIELGDRN